MRKTNIDIEAIKNNQRNNIAEVTNSIFDSLVNSHEHNKINESDFKDHFLPYFAGELPITKDTPILHEWVTVAGTPMNEVDIVDNTGKTILTVPSLYDTNILEIAQRNASVSFDKLYKDHNHEMLNMPMYAENKLLRALDEKLDTFIIPSNQHTHNVEKWNKIFIHYGIDKKTDVDETVKELDNDVEYD